MADLDEPVKGKRLRASPSAPQVQDVDGPLHLGPCRLCGSTAEFGEVDDMDHPDFGGYFIACTNARCQCCVGLRYADKEDPRPLLAEQWNRKPTPSFLVGRNLLLNAAKEALIQAEGCFHNHYPDDDPSQAPEPAHIANLRAAIEAEGRVAGAEQGFSLHSEKEQPSSSVSPVGEEGKGED